MLSIVAATNRPSGEIIDGASFSTDNFARIGSFGVDGWAWTATGDSVPVISAAATT